MFEAENVIFYNSHFLILSLRLLHEKIFGFLISGAIPSLFSNLNSLNFFSNFLSTFMIFNVTQLKFK